MSSPPINYAKAIGFNSLAAAIVFAVAYVPLEGLFLLKSFTRPTYVHFALTFFCTVRIAAFVLRAILISIDSADQNLGVLIADEVLSAVGLFALLYSAYTLVLDIELLSGREETNNPLLLLIRQKKLFKIALLVAVALGISAISATSTQKLRSGSGGNSVLRIVSTILYVFLIVLQTFQALVLFKEEKQNRAYSRSLPHESFGSKHAALILIAISLLLIVREAFSIATVNNFLKQNEERLWYPLIALPELLIAILFSIPGLVPDRKELAGRVPVRNTA